MRKLTRVLAVVGILTSAVVVIVWAKGRGDKGFCWACGLGGEHYPSSARGYSPSLRDLPSGQADFRGNDRDGNGAADFWKKDVAGLFFSKGANGSEIQLIGVSIALADERPAAGYALPRGTSPYQGYWFRAIRHADEAVPDPDRFAFCSFPDDYPRHGRFTFVVSTSADIWKKDLGHGRGVEIFPADLLKEGWTKLD